ncbi:hypothetical protein ON010_g13074 [Phytophthora cinnamomi]|nr:hypothetical protein ON010_g13074 [Phytophthora cinnamomi]
MRQSPELLCHGCNGPAGTAIEMASVLEDEQSQALQQQDLWRIQLLRVYLAQVKGCKWSSSQHIDDASQTSLSISTYPDAPLGLRQSARSNSQRHIRVFSHLSRLPSEKYVSLVSASTDVFRYCEAAAAEPLGLGAGQRPQAAAAAGQLLVRRAVGRGRRVLHAPVRPAQDPPADVQEGEPGAGHGRAPHPAPAGAARPLPRHLGWRHARGHVLHHALRGLPLPQGRGRGQPPAAGEAPQLQARGGRPAPRGEGGGPGRADARRAPQHDPGHAAHHGPDRGLRPGQGGHPGEQGAADARQPADPRAGQHGGRTGSYHGLRARGRGQDQTHEHAPQRVQERHRLLRQGGQARGTARTVQGLAAGLHAAGPADAADVCVPRTASQAAAVILSNT